MGRKLPTALILRDAGFACSSATDLRVKGDLLMEVLSASAGRVKAGASALPRVRLGALTRPADAGLGQSSDLRFGMSRLRIDVTSRPFVAQHGIAVLEGLQCRIVTRRDESAHEQSRPHADLPPPIKLLPFHLPDCRVHEARPASTAISLRPSVPSSGSSAIKVRALAGPMPGTEKVFLLAPGG
jgi:hypothetical protein